MEIFWAIVWVVTLVISVLRRRLVFAAVGLLAPLSLLMRTGEAPLGLLETLLWVGLAGPIIGSLLPQNVDLGPLDR